MMAMVMAMLNDEGEQAGEKTAVSRVVRAWKRATIRKSIWLFVPFMNHLVFYIETCHAQSPSLSCYYPMLCNAMPMPALSATPSLPSCPAMPALRAVLCLHQAPHSSAASRRWVTLITGWSIYPHHPHHHHHHHLPHRLLLPAARPPAPAAAASTTLAE
jgi:hypothetical protein